MLSTLEPLKHDKLLSNVAFNLSLRPYTKVLMPATVRRLGSGPLCSFPNDFELDIYLAGPRTRPRPQLHLRHKLIGLSGYRVHNS